MSLFELVCEHCKNRYTLPNELRGRVRGAQLTCAVCMREWIPLPGDAHDRFNDAGGFAANREPIALHHYLQTSPFDSFGNASSPERPTERSTTRAVRVPVTGARPNLRVTASGPGLELDTVFDLGTRSFLIGGAGTHLDLFHAPSIPDRAIRIRHVGGGFEFSGIDDFLIPIGPVSVHVGRIEAGARLDLILGPYRIGLEESPLPGSTILDLDAPTVSPPTPRYPMAPIAPISPVVPPSASAPAPEPVADMSQTVRGLGAHGFDTRRFANPLEGIDVGLMGLDNPVQGETFWLKKSPALIGRSAGEFQIADARVSGKHAQIDILGVDQYAIKDLASTNGTTVNERPTSTTRLKDGDIIAFGGVRLQFVVRTKDKL